MDQTGSIATARFLHALTYALLLHGSDTRKGTSIPYAAHLLGVCALVIADGGSEDEAVGALLHDALEDHPIETSREEIRARFGEAVLHIVDACTDTPVNYAGGCKADWRERKQRCLDHISQASPQALRVALADKLDNIRSILADCPRGDPVAADSFWRRFNAPREHQLWFYHQLTIKFHTAGITGFLMTEFQRAVNDLEGVCELH